MHSAFRRGPRGVMLALAAGAVFVAACSLSPLRLLGAGRSTPQPPIELRRCDDVQDVLCLVTFGIEPPDEMLILLSTVPGLPGGLALAVTRNDETMAFECVTTEESPTIVYCTGPQIPLGTTVRIEVFVVEEEILLASGEFTLTAFALPTVQAGGVGLPTPGVMLTPRGTPTPQATRTPLPFGTPVPGTAYPNATPPTSPP